MEEKKMILKMIEEGKITADEGLSLLKALEDKKEEPSQDSFTESSSHKQERTQNREQMNRFKEDLQDATEKIITSANKGASKVLDMIGKAVEKLQNLDVDFDFDFNLNGGTKVTEYITVDAFNPKQIQFTLANGSLQINPWEKDYAQIEVNGVISKTKDEAEARKILSEILDHQYENEEFTFSIQERKGVRVSLEVMIPLKVYESLQVYSNNGSIRMADLEIQDIKLETTNGSIRLHEVIGMKVEGQTSNGRIQLNEVEFKNCGLQTSNGSINLRKVAIEQCECFTTNGSIQGSGELQELQGETTNGSIRLEQHYAEKSSIKVKTSNGLIRVVYPKGSQGIYGELTTKHGQMNVGFPHVRTHGEDFNVKPKTYYFEQGEEQNHYVKAATSTGSIHILEREAD